MKAIVYAPTDEKSIRKMQEQLAKIHADAFMNQLNSLHISYDEKIKIMKELKAEISN